jgi:PTH1 family peptidyl-tRNA hydrolase
MILVGLGNPGAEYAKNRHNAGFMAVDAIADAQNFPAWRKKFSGVITEKSGVVLVKPQGYMNLSGQCVGEVVRFYKMELGRLVVFHDELDLPCGTVRIKQGGGSAGHNGLKSITAHLDSPDYWRVRLGIGHPGHRDQVSDYVLHDFSKPERTMMEEICQRIAQSFGVADLDAALAKNYSQ